MTLGASVDLGREFNPEFLVNQGITLAIAAGVFLAAFAVGRAIRRTRLWWRVGAAVAAGGVVGVAVWAVVAPGAPSLLWFAGGALAVVGGVSGLVGVAPSDD